MSRSRVSKIGARWCGDSRARQDAAGIRRGGARHGTSASPPGTAWRRPQVIAVLESSKGEPNGAVWIHCASGRMVAVGGAGKRLASKGDIAAVREFGRKRGLGDVGFFACARGGRFLVSRGVVCYAFGNHQSVSEISVNQSAGRRPVLCTGTVEPAYRNDKRR